MSAHTHTTHIGTRTSCCDESRSDFRIMVTKFLRSSSEWLFKWEGKTQMEFCKSFTRRTISFIKRTNPRLTTTNEYMLCMPSRFISITSHIVIWPSFFRFLMHHHISIFCSFLSLLYVFIPFEECICYLYCCNINIMPQLFQWVFATDLILSITNVVEFHARWQICKPSTTANTHTQTLITIRRKRDMTMGKFNEFDFFF